MSSSTASIAEMLEQFARVTLRMPEDEIGTYVEHRLAEMARPLADDPISPEKAALIEIIERERASDACHCSGCECDEYSDTRENSGDIAEALLAAGYHQEAR